MTKQEESSYLLGQSEDEANRLRDQARRLRDVTQMILSQLGLASGMACLDVGCGAGDVMRLMGEYVGRTGKVTGLDLNGKLGRSVTDSLNSSGISQFDFIEGDVHTAETITAEGYDLTFARFLLLHVTNPTITLSKMWQWTKPGGYLVVMDYDFHTQGTYPKLSVVEEYSRIIYDLFNATGRDPRVGHKLPFYVNEVCGGSSVARHVWAAMFSMSEIADLLSATYKSLLPGALQLGITTEDRAKEFLTEMNKARSSNAQYLAPLVVTAWKQKPAE